jgi:hypothetical protein
MCTVCLVYQPLTIVFFFKTNCHQQPVYSVFFNKSTITTSQFYQNGHKSSSAHSASEVFSPILLISLGTTRLKGTRLDPKVCQVRSRGPVTPVSWRAKELVLRYGFSPTGCSWVVSLSPGSVRQLVQRRWGETEVK